MNNLFEETPVLPKSDPRIVKITSPNGTQKRYKNGKLHREDEPAVIKPDGTQKWCFGSLVLSWIRTSRL